MLEHGDDIDALKNISYPGTERNVEEQLTHNIATIGENMAIRRAVRVEGCRCSGSLHAQFRSW